MTAKSYKLLNFDDQLQLADQLADDIAKQLVQSIAKQGRAVMALSGGSTPLLMMQQLRQRDVDWSKVVVTLVDERCVGEMHSLSNARFVREEFLSKLPSIPKFAPLYYPEASNTSSLFEMVLENYADITASTKQSLASFDVVILGMGGDGHTASFFPDADNIDELIDDVSEQPLLTCQSPASQVARITWSLPMLLDTNMLALHITGQNKQQVLQKAIAGTDKTELPIRAAILQQQTPLSIYYAD